MIGAEVSTDERRRDGEERAHLLHDSRATFGVQERSVSEDLDERIDNCRTEAKIVNKGEAKTNEEEAELTQVPHVIPQEHVKNSVVPVLR